MSVLDFHRHVLVADSAYFFRRISGLIYEETRGVLKVFLEGVIKDSVTYTEHASTSCCHIHPYPLTDQSFSYRAKDRHLLGRCLRLEATGQDPLRFRPINVQPSIRFPPEPTTPIAIAALRFSLSRTIHVGIIQRQFSMLSPIYIVTFSGIPDQSLAPRLASLKLFSLDTCRHLDFT